MSELKESPTQEEYPCPCEDESRENCAACQDLPVWYFDKKNGEVKDV